MAALVWVYPPAYTGNDALASLGTVHLGDAMLLQWTPADAVATPPAYNVTFSCSTSDGWQVWTMDAAISQPYKYVFNHWTTTATSVCHFAFGTPRGWVGNSDSFQYDLTALDSPAFFAGPGAVKTSISTIKPATTSVAQVSVAAGATTAPHTSSLPATTSEQVSASNTQGSVSTSAASSLIAIDTLSGSTRVGVGNSSSVFTESGSQSLMTVQTSGAATATATSGSSSNYQRVSSSRRTVVTASIALAFLVILTMAAGFIWWRRRKHRRSIAQMKTQMDLDSESDDRTSQQSSKGPLDSVTGLNEMGVERDAAEMEVVPKHELEFKPVWELEHIPRYEMDAAPSIHNVSSVTGANDFEI